MVGAGLAPARDPRPVPAILDLCPRSSTCARDPRPAPATIIVNNVDSQAAADMVAVVAGMDTSAAVAVAEKVDMPRALLPSALLPSPVSVATLHEWATFQKQAYKSQ